MGYRKLGRESAHRDLMLRNLVTAVIRNGRIQTTDTRAKETKSLVDKMITLAKRGDLSARRQALSYMTDESVVKDLFENIAPKYQDRQGGYTRIVKIAPRKGDGAPMVILELV